jgi:hypothetical protein
MNKHSKSHYQQWLAVHQSSRSESQRLSHAFMSRPGKMSIKSGDGLFPDPFKNEKARFKCHEQFVIFRSQGARIAKAGLVALARIFNVPCNSTGNSAQASM